MLGLTPLGTIHTAVSLVAVIAGLVSLVRDREISPRTRLGRLYVVTTVVTCATGFGIFEHGGFGKPHVLGVVTLLVLGLAAVAARTSAFGRASRYVEAVAYSATFFFHFIPGLVETTTRLPLGAPLVADREGPELQAATGVLFLLFVIGATLQVRRMRTRAHGAVARGAGPRELVTDPSRGTACRSCRDRAGGPGRAAREARRRDARPASTSRRPTRPGTADVP